MENIIAALSKIALVHEKDDATGGDRWLLAAKTEDDDED
jgi:H+-transporting ATPase